jgi:prepilin signal peptidase PulO-like enzyme (type II secretory pathway)
MDQKVKEKIEFLVKVVEIVICIIILASVIAGLPDLVMYAFDSLLTGNLEFSYRAFQEFLKYALILVVGIELLEMILTRSHESILTLILFVIARKMLVYSAGMVDILIGSISISIIFLVIKYVSKDHSLMATIDNTFSASMPLKRIAREYNIKVPIGMSNTLGGLVYELAKLEEIEEIKEGGSFVYGDYIYKVVSMSNGVMQRIRIEKNK